MQKSYHSGARRHSSSFRSGSRRNVGRRQQQTRGIHPSQFINKSVSAAEETVYEPNYQFTEFALNRTTQQTLATLGFITPSPIQDQCIKPALDGQDVIGLANTGTGKTAAFLLPIIEKLYTSRAPIGALVLAPTRELAQQIEQEFRRFSIGQKLYSTIVVGGANIGRQIEQIKRRPHIVIGTPGRIKDLINRRVLDLSRTGIFVLDEADRMCDMGFSKDIRYIAAQLPQERQTLCFSATMTKDIKIIVEEFMQDPVTISVVRRQTHEHIEQDVIHASDKAEKIELLTDLLAQDDFKKVVIFGETKFGVQRLADSLNRSNLLAAAIHGNKSQSQRERVLKSFKKGDINILVATDVAARGLDVPDVTHVINFDPPKTFDDYIHRIGRTGRAGKTGKALTFVSK